MRINANWNFTEFGKARREWRRGEKEKRRRGGKRGWGEKLSAAKFRHFGRDSGEKLPNIYPRRGIHYALRRRMYARTEAPGWAWGRGEFKFRLEGELRGL